MALGRMGGEKRLLLAGAGGRRQEVGMETGIVRHGGVAGVADGEPAGKAGGGNGVEQVQFEGEGIDCARRGVVRQPQPQGVGTLGRDDLPRMPE